MILNLSGVLRDATVPAGTAPPQQPFQQDLEIARYESGTIIVTVSGQDYQAKDITDGYCVLAVRSLFGDPPIISRLGVVTDPTHGVVEFTIVNGDSVSLSANGYYLFDVTMLDANGVWWQIVPASRLYVGQAMSVPDEIVTAPNVDLASILANYVPKTAIEEGAPVTPVSSVVTFGPGASFDVGGGGGPINAFTIAGAPLGIFSVTFTDAYTINHDTAEGAGTAPLFLLYSSSYNVPAGTTILFAYDGTYFRQQAPMSPASMQ